MRSVKYYLFGIFLLVAGCHEKTLTIDELRQYVREEQNGLIKRIPGSAISVEAFYWPRQLLFGIGDSEGSEAEDAQYDGIDYFMIRCETRLSNVLDDPAASVLIVNRDTLTALDAISLPQVGMEAWRDYRVLVAFSGNLQMRRGEGKVLLGAKMAGTYNYIPFSNADIRRVHDIKIIN